MTRRNPHFTFAVIARDKECQVCGTIENLHAHHIIPVSIGGLDVSENGEALCASCHADRHPDVPRGLFLISVSGKANGNGKPATILAAELDCCVRTIVKIARKCGFQRQGARWNFSPLQCEAIGNYRKRPKVEYGPSGGQAVPTSECITTAQAAEMLGVKSTRIQKQAQYGLFSGARKFGEGKRGRWMIPLAAVLAYQARRWSPGRPPQEAGAEGGENDDAR